MAAVTTSMPHVAVFDTETTGFKPKNGDRILEIAIVRLSPTGEELARWSTLLNPGDDVELGAVHIHGITRAMLADAPSFADVAGDVIAHMQDAVVAAHNASFDIGFLRNEFELAGLTWPEPVVADTLGAARFLLPGLPAYKLGSLADHLGIRFDGDAHSALADALVTAELFRELVKRTKDVPWPATVDTAWPSLSPTGRSVTR